MNMPPIRYSRRQLALMITIARFFEPAFPGRRPEAIKALGLDSDTKGYLWNPR